VSSLTEKPQSGGGTRPRRSGLQFFLVLDGYGSVSAAAAELGFNQMTCYQWVQ
jgi:hypothetical protein